MGLVAALWLTPGLSPGVMAATEPICPETAAPVSVELTLAKKWKGKDVEIRQSFREVFPSTKVRIEFFPFLDPPQNIAIGRCVPADLARIALRQAEIINQGVDRLVVQHVLPHAWIGIGTTKLTEDTWVPITPKDLVRLLDPDLSTEQFHALYRELASVTERRLPFGLGTVPLKPGQVY